MENEVKKPLSDTLTIVIDKNTYVINLPDTGKFIDIEREKIRLAGGYQNQLMDTNNGFFARMLIDTIATFSILIPTFVTDLNIESIFKADLMFTKKIVKIYSKEFMPWYNQWVDVWQDIED